MDVNVMQNRQMRSLAAIMGASIFAAVSTMFIPVSVLENITGATGLSELVPATAAPLGDTARALIAFATGALTLAVTAVLLLRSDATTHKAAAAKNPDNADIADEAQHVAGIPENDDDLVPSFGERFARLGLRALKLPRMPWMRDDDDITELADLPKLRGGDVHPDAPPRRPLLATTDLPVLDLTDTHAVIIDEIPSAPAAIVEPDSPKGPAATVVTRDPETAMLLETSPTPAEPSLAEMVSQLEIAVAQRRQQIAQLETIAAQLTADSGAATVPEHIEAESAEMPDEPEYVFRPAAAERPPLEAVPASEVKQDDMDEALAAALATLHRMNGTAG